MSVVLRTQESRRESCNLILSEAWSDRNPVVATEVGGASESMLQIFKKF
jgi:hypothetical protein